MGKLFSYVMTITLLDGRSPPHHEYLDSPKMLPENDQLDSYAVSVQKAGIIVRLVPHEVFTSFTGQLHEVIGHRKPGKGLEIPYRNTLTGKPKPFKEDVKLLHPSTETEYHHETARITSYSTYTSTL